MGGIHGKATTMAQIKGGQLPCVATKKDMANLLLGQMTPDALEKVTNNDAIRNDVKGTAQAILDKPKIAEQLQGMSQAAKDMEKAQTEEERQKIAEDLEAGKKNHVPTEEESNQAAAELADLFDAM